MPRLFPSYGTPIFFMDRASGEDSYVLCEINVSSVFAIPDQAPAAIAQLTLKRLQANDAKGAARQAHLN